MHPSREDGCPVVCGDAGLSCDGVKRQPCAVCSGDRELKSPATNYYHFVKHFY